jgi:predicted short-subunit dehydrogenase-like oxidoreductase (DUF2520 family)
MRELDRIAVIGAGRLGSALAPALRATGLAVDGPLGRGVAPEGATVVLLCVPDAEIPRAAAALAPGPLVGHCSGATGLAALGEHEGFGLHPLMTLAAGPATTAASPVTTAPSPFAGAGCAVAGTTPRALAVAHELAAALEMRAVVVADHDRHAYHAAASIASNFLVTLQSSAERLAATAGVERELLVPLVRAAVENWAALGSERALTGPIVRGDEVTVARQRAAVAERAPELLALFDALTDATRALAAAPAREEAAG